MTKAQAKEEKYARSLAAAEKKHNTAVAGLNKAKEEFAHRQAEHQKLIAARDNKNQELEKVKAVKEQHDVSLGFLRELTWALTMDTCRLNVRLSFLPLLRPPRLD